MIKEIKERASKRVYSDKKISENDIRTILEAGRLAPSWMNVQPWHFIAVSKQETKDLLCELSFGQKQVKTASWVILCCADTTAWDSDKFRKILREKGSTDDQIDGILQNSTLYPKLKGSERTFLRTVEQCTYAMAYMTLEAQELGISSCIIGAFGNDLTESNQEVYMKIREKLNIPKNIFITSMITLGYDAKPETQPKKIRKPFDEIASCETYGQKF